jgi:ABC-type transport system substrate-binding protein
MYHRALEIMLEQGWTIPVSWRQDVFAIKDNIQNFRTDMSGAVWLHETWLAQ